MRGRLSGRLSASALICAIIFSIIGAAAAADSVAVKSDDRFAQAAPVVLVPGHTTLPIGAGPAVTNPSDLPSRNISLDFHAADIADVLKALATQTGTNIVTGKDVKGQVTVSLSHVGLNDALDMVTKVSGFKYAMVGQNTYVVGSAQGLAEVLGTSGTTSETVAVEVVSLQFANGDDLAKTIPDLVPGVRVSYGNPIVQGDDRKDPIWDITPPGKDPLQRAKPATKPTRVLILVGEPQAVARAKDIALKSEAAAKTADGQVVTEVYFPKYGDATELGQVVTVVSPSVSVTLGPTTNFQLKQSDIIKGGYAMGGPNSVGQYEFKAQPTSIVLIGPAEDVKRAMAALERIDCKPAQIRIEARIVDLDNADALNLGIAYAWTPLTTSGSQTVDSSHGHTTTDSVDSRVISRTTNITWPTVTATIDAMATSGKAKLLASPSISAVVGKPANIFIGDEITYVINIQTTPTGQNVTTATAEVGIQLRALGTVGPDDEITLNLHPEVSVVSSYLQVGGGIALPQIARRFTDNTLRIKSGTTVAIGGLIRDTDIDNMQKIPLLGDLPFFGQLFRHRNHSKDHSEVTIFLNACVIKD